MNNKQLKRTIGIITGSGPEAGIDLWKKILNANKNYLIKEKKRNYRGDEDAPNVIIYSISELGRSMHMKDHKDNVWQLLSELILKISNEVDFFCIACYTLHCFSKKIEKITAKEKFVSLFEVISQYIEAETPESACLLHAGANDLQGCELCSCMEKYTNLIYPENLQEVRDLIFEVKKNGSDCEDITRRFQEIIGRISSSSTIILACTELPLININLKDKSIVDGTQLLAENMIQKYYQ